MIDGLNNILKTIKSISIAHVTKPLSIVMKYMHDSWYEYKYL